MVAIFFLSGLVFANLGLLGLYIGRIFDEAKERPLYIIKDKKGW
jgi:dolichol-phosphate mannosyltransferase